MGDELNEKTSQLIGVFSGSYFRAVTDPTFFGKNSSNPFSRSYFFGQLVFYLRTFVQRCIIDEVNMHFCKLSMDLLASGLFTFCGCCKMSGSILI